MLDRRQFLVGVNYWPARTAMRWWQAFDPAEVRVDFGRLVEARVELVRIFLLWEDFQPQNAAMNLRMVTRLEMVLDIAAELGILVMPTLFTGHMSGANWLPGWMLGGSAVGHRFRVVSGGRVVDRRIRNWYLDASAAKAQAFKARCLSRAMAGHPALGGWDLGNESSNCVTPLSVTQAKDWLQRVSEAIRESDSRVALTMGLHMEDLEDDRKLGPKEAAEVCDFLTMHGYPGYAKWARGPTDELVLPFLAILTRWLGGGMDVLFSELGVPTSPVGQVAPVGQGSLAHALVSEDEAATFIERALVELHRCGCMGAMLWCYADYQKACWDLPPLDLAAHERCFGQWRADGSPKPSALALRDFKVQSDAERGMQADSSWIDCSSAEFFASDEWPLPRLYKRYLAERGVIDE